MALFNKKIGRVFLKKEDRAKEYADKLELLYNSAKEPLKEEIGMQLAIIKAGIRGEQEIAYELKNSEIDMYIIHDLQLEVNEEISSQIDYMVITRKHIYIIECKNLIGNIEITSSGDFIRTYEYNGKRVEKRIYSPITQNDIHLNTVKQLCLESKGNFWAKHIFEKEFNNLYKSLVVLANSESVLNARYAKKEIKEKVVHADQLVKIIKEIDSKQEKKMSEKEMRKIADFFCSMDRPEYLFYNKKYQELEARVNEESVRSVEEMIIKLKAFRSEKSREEKIKAYYIFNDAQMEELVVKMPSSKEELKMVPGFGDVKVEKYGEEIIKILHSE